MGSEGLHVSPRERLAATDDVVQDKDCLEILLLLDEKNPRNLDEIRKKTQLDEEKLEECVNTLEKSGLIEQRNAYRITEKGERLVDKMESL